MLDTLRTSPGRSATSVSSERSTILTVYGSRIGVGGLGIHAANVLKSLASGSRRVVAVGPGQEGQRCRFPGRGDVEYHDAPPMLRSHAIRMSWLRYLRGRVHYLADRRLGAWAVEHFRQHQPDGAYLFTQVALEGLIWCRDRDVPTMLDSPTGHVRAFWRANRMEAAKWLLGWHWGHPTRSMVSRVEAEYEAADAIRVSSRWAKQTMVDEGVPARKVHVAPQPIDLATFHPPERERVRRGPLRVCYVGSLSLGKGFAYLLRALRAIGQTHAQLEIVGSTGDPWSRYLFAKESRGLAVTVAPGDPLPAYHRAEVLVLPTLHDGFGFVVGEALATGIPVIVTTSCGAAEWVRHGTTGWIIPPADPDAVAGALHSALSRRHELEDMGRLGRADVEALGGTAAFGVLRDLFDDAVRVKTTRP